MSDILSQTDALITALATTPDEQIVFWDCRPDREELHCDSIEDAVQAWASEQDGPLPETVTVYGFARMELPSPVRIASRVVEHLLEWIDDEYGDPSGDSGAGDGLDAAALEFAETFRTEYQVWTCKEVTRQVVTVADYYTADSPQQLEEAGSP